MEAKHPVGPEVAIPPDLPSAQKAGLTHKKLRDLIRRSRRGSSPGPSRLTFENIREAALGAGPAAHACLGAVANFLNALIDGRLHPDSAPFIGGARLIPLIKAQNDERPIAIGETLRRLAASHLARFAGVEAANYLLPTQTSFAVSGGTEAISRTLRSLWQERRADRNFAIMSIDGRNAFNTVDRAQMLNEVRLRCPELARFAYFLYARPAVLYFGASIIYSCSGTHQGCPLGPLFFNLGIHPMLEALRGLRRAGHPEDLLMLAAYSDNIYFATGAASIVVQQALDIVDRTHGPQAGYQRGSTTLCMPRIAEEDEDVVTDAMDIDWHPRNVGLVPVKEFVALGVPIGSPAFVEQFLSTKLSKLEALFSAIDALDDAQVQLYLLTRSMSICRVTHLMRCLPPTHELRNFIDAYSNLLRRSITNLLNREDLTDAAWRQAQLKYSEAGLGLGNPQLTLDAAFISSVSGSMQLALGFMGRLEDGEHGVFDATAFEPLLEETVQRYNAALPAEAARYEARTLPHGLRQDALSLPLMEAEYEAVEMSFSELADNERMVNTARLRSCRSSESSAFLTAVPNEKFKTKMISSHFRVAVELRLGSLHCAGRRCAFGCGTILDANGAHATSCKASGMAKVRHDHVKETLGNAMHQAGMNVLFEPRNLIDNNGRLKPADVSVSGLSSSGIFTNIDVTVVCPTCPAHLASGQTKGLVAQTASNKKVAKYLAHHCRVKGAAMEVYGTMCKTFKWICHRIVANYTAVHPDIDRFSEKVQTTYVLQVLSVALQSGNAQQILACADPLLERRLLNSVDVYAPPVLARETLRIEHD